MKRLGAVLMFRKDVTRKQALDALFRLSDVFDVGERVNQGPLPIVIEIDDQDGGPSWYRDGQYGG